jgi:hypothetical protein
LFSLPVFCVLLNYFEENITEFYACSSIMLGQKMIIEFNQSKETQNISAILIFWLDSWLRRQTQKFTRQPGVWAKPKSVMLTGSPAR